MGEDESVSSRLARIETKLDVFLPKLNEHEKELRALDKWRYGITAAVVMGVSSVIVAFTK